MNLVDFLISIALGALSGWIAGEIMKSKGGLLRNILLGIVGGAIAGALFGLIGISFGGIIGTIIVSVIGACLLIFLANKFLK